MFFSSFPVQVACYNNKELTGTFSSKKHFNIEHRRNWQAILQPFINESVQGLSLCSCGLLNEGCALLWTFVLLPIK